MDPINVADFEALARSVLPKAVFDYYAGGAHDGVTLGENASAFKRIRLRPRVLVDVSQRDLATTVLGTPVSMPILVAPTAFHGLAHADAERATARAARTTKTAMCLSTLSNAPVESVAAELPGSLWFQLYIYRDRALTRDLVQRAKDAGCRALVFTVDAPLLGRRELDVRNGFHLPKELVLANVAAAGLGSLDPVGRESSLAAHFASLLDPKLTWDDVSWLREMSHLPVVVKGVLRGDDAQRAVAHGAAAVVVSNHGGRQLDTALATIDALPEVAGAVAGKAEIYLDGGVRRGTDVLKAIALGARAVLVGRPVLWGLATGGERGVVNVLELLRSELDLAMALAGCRNVSEITRDLVTLG